MFTFFPSSTLGRNLPFVIHSVCGSNIENVFSSWGITSFLIRETASPTHVGNTFTEKGEAVSFLSDGIIACLMRNNNSYSYLISQKDIDCGLLYLNNGKYGFLSQIK